MDPRTYPAAKARNNRVIVSTLLALIITYPPFSVVGFIARLLIPFYIVWTRSQVFFSMYGRFFIVNHFSHLHINSKINVEIDKKRLTLWTIIDNMQPWQARKGK